MTKADIINEVAIATGMPKKEVGTVVEAFMEEVKKCLIEKKDNVYLRTQPSRFQLTTYQASSHQRASSRRCRTLSNTAGQEERNIIFYNNNILKF